MMVTLRTDEQCLGLTLFDLSEESDSVGKFSLLQIVSLWASRTPRFSWLLSSVQRWPPRDPELSPVLLSLCTFSGTLGHNTASNTHDPWIFASSMAHQLWFLQLADPPQPQPLTPAPYPCPQWQLFYNLKLMHWLSTPLLHPTAPPKVFRAHSLSLWYSSLRNPLASRTILYWLFHIFTVSYPFVSSFFSLLALNSILSHHNYILPCAVDSIAPFSFPPTYLVKPILVRSNCLPPPSLQLNVPGEQHTATQTGLTLNSWPWTFSGSWMLPGNSLAPVPFLLSLN